MARHSESAFSFVLVLSAILGVVLSVVQSHLFVLYILLIFIGYIAWSFANNWVCICPRCKEEASRKYHRYCQRCGELTAMKKKEKVWEVCSCGYRIDNRYNNRVYCPECGQIVAEEEVYVVKEKV